MSKLPWTPWHQVARLRPDVRTGELSLASFAADLYDVAMGGGRRVYQDPAEFFALTYPTYNLRQLARDVIVRLAGENDKAVRQLELTYGGGKTHTLITLYHLARDPASLPKITAVQEFLEHAGRPLVPARIAVLAFDKLDVEKGMEVLSPQGERRWLKHPWSVLAFQIAGAEGLRLLHPDSQDDERSSAPAENLLTTLLALPARDGLATLILIDELLMYARGKVALDPSWRSRLVDFFQYLTQAATKVDRCAIVASLLATDPGKSDALGKELIHELYAIFRREREEGVEPVSREDVAEILRRRFFTRESIADHNAFRPHVLAALKGVAELDEPTRKDQKSAEEDLLSAYPFNPPLTDLFYSKWTNLEGFQRTRGILRTFALALRDAEKWDQSPLVSANVFLAAPGQEDLAEAARELTSVAATEDYEGRRQEWNAILQTEMRKAREIQVELPGLAGHREMEQAVLATFLHSQPIGQKAQTRDLVLLLGATRPDRIDLEKGLRRWLDVSWFLDETAAGEPETGPEGMKRLPAYWRLGSRPNLRQMHHDARTRIDADLVDSQLLDELPRQKSLSGAANAAGARVHTLPERPRDVPDDGEFRFAILGPQAVSDAGRPSLEARRFLDETTGPDRPRVKRNAVLLAVPSRDGLEAARARLRDLLAWQEVQSQLAEQELDPIRQAMLMAHLRDAERSVPETIRQAWCIAVTVSEDNQVQAFKVQAGDEPLFLRIKADPRSRIRDQQVSAEALLPGGPYQLWREDEPSHRLKDLVSAFAEFPRLPKMLRRQEILDTIVQGVRKGIFVLRFPRPDGSARTFWREIPEEATLADPATEVVRPESAVLTHLAADLVEPGELPGLWDGPQISVAEIQDYFSGERVVTEAEEDEPVAVPRAETATVQAAVRQAVEAGTLWLISGPASLCREALPPGVLTAEALVQAPPLPVSPAELLPPTLPSAWSDGLTSALALSSALSQKRAAILPWHTVLDAVDGALRTRILERAENSGPWPCGFAGASEAVLRLPISVPVSRPTPTPATALVAEAELSTDQLQDLVDRLPELKKTAVGLPVKFRLRVEFLEGTAPPQDTLDRLNLLLGEISGLLVLK